MFRPTIVRAALAVLFTSIVWISKCSWIFSLLPFPTGKILSSQYSSCTEITWNESVWNSSSLENDDIFLLEHTTCKKTVIGTVEIEKTGSTTLRTAFCKAKRDFALKSMINLYSTAIELYSHGCSPPVPYRSYHHQDLTRTTEVIESLHGTSKNILYVTILRRPDQRLVSEFLHMKGRVALYRQEGHAWGVSQPTICSKSSFQYDEVVLEGLDLVERYHTFRENFMAKYNLTENHFRDRTKFPLIEPLFVQWLLLGAANPANNRMTRMMAGPIPCVEVVQDSRIYNETWLIQSATANLNIKTIFGINEKYFESLMLMNCQFDQVQIYESNSGPKFHINTVEGSKPKNERYHGGKKTDYSFTGNQTAAILQQSNALDFTFYDFAQNLFNTRLTKYSECVSEGVPSGLAK